MLDTSYQISEWVFYTYWNSDQFFSTKLLKKWRHILFTHSSSNKFLYIGHADIWHIYEFQNVLTSFVRTAGLITIFVPRISCKLKIKISKYLKRSFWFQTFAVLWMLYSLIWVILWRLNFIYRRFGTLFHLHKFYENGTVFRNFGI